MSDTSVRYTDVFWVVIITQLLMPVGSKAATCFSPPSCDDFQRVVRISRTRKSSLHSDYHYAPPNLLAGQGLTHRHRLPLPTVYPYAPATPTHAPVAATSTRHRHRTLAAAHAHALGQAVIPTNSTGCPRLPESQAQAAPALLAGQGRTHKSVIEGGTP